MTLGELGGSSQRPTLRFVREFAHPPEVVWRAVTSPEHLSAWFPQQIDGEWKVGGRLEFSADAMPSFFGEVLACEPPSLLEFTWGTDVLRLKIEPVACGSRLVFTDTFDEFGKAARDAAGWHVCLDQLACSLAGTRPEGSQAERWRAVHVEYVRALGPAAGTIGPPAGWDGS